MLSKKDKQLTLQVKRERKKLKETKIVKKNQNICKTENSDKLQVKEI